MSYEWTPALEGVRARYVTRYDARAFDRWLAAHDEQVRAAERERCIRVATVAGMRTVDNHPVFDPMVSFIVASIRSEADPAEQKESNHKVTQVPPWPPYPEADYMLTKWKCSCGWSTVSVRDSKNNREELDERRQAAAAHEQQESTN